MPARLINIKYITIRAEKVASPVTALHTSRPCYSCTGFLSIDEWTTIWHALSPCAPVTIRQAPACLAVTTTASSLTLVAICSDRLPTGRASFDVHTASLVTEALVLLVRVLERFAILLATEQPTNSLNGCRKHSFLFVTAYLLLRNSFANCCTRRPVELAALHAATKNIINSKAPHW